MFIVLEKTIYKYGNEEYMEQGYNEEIRYYEYQSMEEAIESGEFAPQIISQICKGETVSLQNLVRGGTIRTLKEEGITFLCSATI